MQEQGAWLAVDLADQGGMFFLAAGAADRQRRVRGQVGSLQAFRNRAFVIVLNHQKMAFGTTGV